MTKVPYNYVPTAGRDNLERKPFVAHDAFSGTSGTIEVVMKTLTPLCIPDPEGSYKQIRIRQEEENQFSEGTPVLFEEIEMSSEDKDKIQKYFARNLMKKESTVPELIQKGYCGEAWKRWQSDPNTPPIPEGLKSLSDEDILDKMDKSPLLEGDILQQDWIRVKAGKGGHGHTVLPFFCLNEEPSIPSTSLKGMFENAFRALTNSCFSHLGNHEHTQRLPPVGEDQKDQTVDGLSQDWLETGIAVQSGSDWYIVPARELMVLRNDLPRGISISSNAQVDFNYENKSRYVLLGYDIIDSPTNPRGILMEYRAGVDLMAEKKYKARIVALPTMEKMLPTDLLYRAIYDNKAIPVADLERDGAYPIPLEVLERYARYIKLENAERKKKEKKCLPGEVNLHPGDFVYFTVCNKKVSSFGKNYRYKRVAKYSMEEYFTRHFPYPACKDLQCLCPACRAFGLVQGKTALAGRIQGKTALAGRISFGFGHLVKWDEQKKKSIAFTPEECKSEKEKWEQTTLKVLGTPRSSYTGFSLEWLDKEKNDTIYASDDRPPEEVRPRGRKKYWHHPNPLQLSDYQDDRNKGKPHKDHINCTAQLCPSERYFRFVVDFSNLEPQELGLLLYLLSFGMKGGTEPYLAHKLGHGRPLGLGSVQTVALNLRIENQECYEDWSKPCLTQARLGVIGYVNFFQQELAKTVTKDTKTLIKFEELPHIQAFRTIAHWPQTKFVSYPSLDGEIYKWHMENKYKPEGNLYPAH